MNKTNPKKVSCETRVTCKGSFFFFFFSRTLFLNHVSTGGSGQHLSEEHTRPSLTSFGFGRHDWFVIATVRDGWSSPGATHGVHQPDARRWHWHDPGRLLTRWRSCGHRSKSESLRLLWRRSEPRRLMTFFTFKNKNKSDVVKKTNKKKICIFWAQTSKNIRCSQAVGGRKTTWYSSLWFIAHPT